MRSFAAVLPIFVLLSLSARPAAASTITAVEVIGDSTCTLSSPYTGCGDLTRDLYRTRQVGAGPTVTENADANITASLALGGNAVDANFGLWNVLGNSVVNDVTYSHVMTWMTGWPLTLTSAQLVIYSYDAAGSNDIVTVDAVSLGFLSSTSGIQQTTFTNGSVLTQMVDGVLNVSINKSNNDEINVFKSMLTVTYDVNDDVSNQSVTAVPEPASLVLLGTGLIALGARLRRFVAPPASARQAASRR